MMGSRGSSSLALIPSHLMYPQTSLAQGYNLQTSAEWAEMKQQIQGMGSRAVQHSYVDGVFIQLVKACRAYAHSVQGEQHQQGTCRGASNSSINSSVHIADLHLSVWVTRWHPCALYYAVLNG